MKPSPQVISDTCRLMASFLCCLTQTPETGVWQFAFQTAAELFRQATRRFLSHRSVLSSHLGFFLRVLRELVVLDDLSLVLSGAVAHPDPAKVLRSLKTDEDED